jgi:hypothetical protein
MSAFISIREQQQEREIEHLRTSLSRLCMVFEQHFPTMSGQVKSIQDTLFADFTANQITLALGYLNGNGPRGMALQAVYGDAAAEMHERELPVRYPQEGLGDLAAMLRQSFVTYQLGSRNVSVRLSKLSEGSLNVSTSTTSIFTGPEYAETAITRGNLTNPKAVDASEYTVVLPFRPADEPRNRVVVFLPLGSAKPTFLVYVPLEECWVNAGETDICYVDWSALAIQAQGLIASAGLESTGIGLDAAFERVWTCLSLFNIPVVGSEGRWEVQSCMDWRGGKVEMEWFDAEFQYVKDGNIDALQLRIGFDVFTLVKGVDQLLNEPIFYRFSSAGDTFGLQWDSVPFQTRLHLIDVYMTTIAATAALASEPVIPETPGDADASP